MLKASLKHHSPVTLYEFLERQVGPLKLLIKDGEAIIKFQSEKHGKLALDKYFSFMLGNKRIELKPYEEKGQEEEKMEVQENEENDVMVRKHNILKEFSAILEGLQVKDGESMVEKIVKDYKKKMVQHIIVFDSFMLEAKEKVRKYNQAMDPNNQKIKKINRAVEIKMENIFKKVKNEFSILTNEIKNIDLREINLDVELQFVRFQQKPLHVTGFKEYINYEQLNFAKRLFPLDHQHFIASGPFLTVFDINQTEIQGTAICRECPYGLLTHDKYLIAGTSEGFFSFYHQDRLNQQELSPRMFEFQQGKQAFITDLLSCRNRANGFNLLALTPQVIKSFYVNEEEVSSGINSLFFQEMHAIKLQGNSFFKAFEHLDQKQELLISSNSILRGYELNKGKWIREIITESQIIKVKKVDENTIFLGQSKKMSLVDLRGPEDRKRFSFKGDITSLCVLNDFGVAYGTERGQFGVFDVRKGLVEANITSHKQSKIYDIIRMNEIIISCDGKGQIVSWKSVI